MFSPVGIAEGICMCVCVLNLIFFFFFEPCKKHLLFYPLLLNTLLKGLPLSASGVRGLERYCRMEIYGSSWELRDTPAQLRARGMFFYCFTLGTDTPTPLTPSPLYPSPLPRLWPRLFFFKMLLARPPHWLDIPALSNLSSVPATPGMTFLSL